jgi:hypothetical protein
VNVNEHSLSREPCQGLHAGRAIYYGTRQGFAGSGESFLKAVDHRIMYFPVTYTMNPKTCGDAFRRLTVARRLQVPDTADQVRWVKRFAATRQVP